jgi:hypothetical protein
MDMVRLFDELPSTSSKGAAMFVVFPSVPSWDSRSGLAIKAVVGISV